MDASIIAPEGASLSPEDVSSFIHTRINAADFAGKKVLLIIPDGTRTAPVGEVFKNLHDHVAAQTTAFDILIALGTHAPMSEDAINARLDITAEERAARYSQVRVFNHEWDNPQALSTLGAIPSSEIAELSGGLFAMDVEVRINKLVHDYDILLIIGPVFPHEVVGFSGGNKYFFPGISGPEVLNFFHWLAAVVTNARIIGTQWTPVRKVVDRAGDMVPGDKRCIAAVVHGPRLAALCYGTPRTAWEAACKLSAPIHITVKDRPFHTILSCAPKMYDELWVGGKCMYKLEPVLADGGELIIYAPHIHEVSITHGKLIEEIGYHCRDYFLKQWDRFKDYPWGVLAHSTHVYGQGTYENGVETPRARVTLATGIPEEICRKINLGYRDPASIRPEDFAGREEEGVLWVPKAGEELFRLKNQPPWAVL